MAAAPIRVLLADDTADLRLVLRVFLEADGEFTVVGEAADGAEAVELAAAGRPDAVVLDLAMPVMDGLEAAEQIRTHSPSTKIVVLSGSDRERIAEVALARGASAYLQKGTELVNVAATIARLCRDADPALGLPPRP